MPHKLLSELVCLLMEYIGANVFALRMIWDSARCQIFDSHPPPQDKNECQHGTAWLVFLAKHLFCCCCCCFLTNLEIRNPMMHRAWKVREIFLLDVVPNRLPYWRLRHLWNMFCIRWFGDSNKKICLQENLWYFTLNKPRRIWRELPNKLGTEFLFRIEF